MRHISLLILISACAFGCGGTTVVQADNDAGDQDSTTSGDSASTDSGGGDTAVDSVIDDTTSPTDTATSPTDTGSPDADAMSDGAGDAAVIPVVKCGSVDCAPGEVCCHSTIGGMTTCTTGTCGPDTVRLECDGPEDCPSSAPFCCAENAHLVGSGFMCGVALEGASCKATCGSSVSYSCPADMQRARLCHSKSECTEPLAENCCKFVSGIWTTTICLGDGLMTDNAAKCY